MLSDSFPLPLKNFIASLIEFSVSLADAYSQISPAYTKNFHFITFLSLNNVLQYYQQSTNLSAEALIYFLANRQRSIYTIASKCNSRCNASIEIMQMTSQNLYTHALAQYRRKERKRITLCHFGYITSQEAQHHYIPFL